MLNLVVAKRNSTLASLLLVAFAFGASCKSASPNDSDKNVQVEESERELPPGEDELGVAGAPVDESSFDFEPEPSAGPHLLETVNVPETSDEIAKGLSPFMDARRTKLQSIGRNANYVLAVTRMGQIAQGYRVDEPMAPPRQVTFSDEPVEQLAMVPKTPGAFIYRTDVAGNEDYQVVRVERDRGASLVTNGTSRHGRFSWSPTGDRVAFTGNARNGVDMDIYVAPNHPDARPELLAKRDGRWSVSAWSRDGTQILAREYVAHDQSTFHLVDTATGESEAVAPLRPGVAYLRGSFGPAGTLFVTSDRGGEFASLYRVTLEDRAWENLTPDARHDVVETAYDASSNRLAYTLNRGGLSSLHIIELDTGEERTASIPAGVVSALRFTRKGGVLAFTFDQPTATGDVYTYDLATETLQGWTDSMAPPLRGRWLAPARPISFTSFDGLEVPAWSFMPRGEGPHPVLLWIHGGPEDEFQPKFHPFIQYLVAELGIAVIAPNIRGSEGYGRTYVGLDNGMKREDAIKDVGALLDWIGGRDELDSQRVGIFGASYGGYVVLASMIRYPDRFAAGANMVGISNFVTFLEKTREYRVGQRRAEYGDEREPEMRKFLQAISPTTNASRIVRPLFVAHGANDPRVPVAEARQIFEAVKNNGADAWLMVAHDEGHGFSKRHNRDAFYGALATFLSRHLVERSFDLSDARGSRSEGAKPDNEKAAQ